MNSLQKYKKTKVQKEPGIFRNLSILKKFNLVNSKEILNKTSFLKTQLLSSRYMGLRVNPHLHLTSKQLKLSSRARLNKDARDNNQTVLFPSGSEIKVTKAVKVFSFGDAFDIELPSWIPFLGRKSYRVQGEGTSLDELGRPENKFQVVSASVIDDKLEGADIVSYDPVGKSTKFKDCKFKIGDRLEPNPLYFSCNRFTMDYVDLHRFEGDYSYKAACPDELTPPFTIRDIALGFYSQKSPLKEFIPVSPTSPRRILKKAAPHYLLEGPIVDSYTIRNGKHELVPYPVYFPRDLIEERFVLWNPNNQRQAA